VPRSVEAFPRRSKDQVQNLDGSQELGILYDESEVKQITSTMGTISIEI